MESKATNYAIFGENIFPLKTENPHNATEITLNSENFEDVDNLYILIQMF